MQDLQRTVDGGKIRSGDAGRQGAAKAQGQQDGIVFLFEGIERKIGAQALSAFDAHAQRGHLRHGAVRHGIGKAEGRDAGAQQAAGLVPGVEQGHVVPGRSQFVSGHQTGRARTDHGGPFAGSGGFLGGGGDDGREALGKVTFDGPDVHGAVMAARVALTGAFTGVVADVAQHFAKGSVLSQMGGGIFFPALGQQAQVALAVDLERAGLAARADGQTQVVHDAAVNTVAAGQTAFGIDLDVQIGNHYSTTSSCIVF